MLIPQSSLSDIIADFSTKMNFLVAEIICEFNKITNNLEMSQGIHGIEFLWSQALHKCGEIMRELIHTMMGQLDEKKLIRTCKNEFLLQGIRLENAGKPARTILTTRGEITYKRTMLVPANEESRARLKELHNCSSVFPLDKVLGIHKLPFKMSPKMMLLCVFCGQNQPSYKAAAEILADLGNIQVSSETIRKVVNEVGGKLFEEDCAKSGETYENCSIDFNPPDENAILYAEVDGAALNTRTKDDNGSTWRENKLGVCFKSDDIKQYVHPRTGNLEHRIEARQYVSYLGKAGEFRKHLFDMLIENGYGQGRQLVLLSDGAAWIANMAQEDYPDCQHILDIYHLKENIFSYAREVFQNDESKYRPWAENICQMVREGRIDEVIAILATLPAIQNRNCVNLPHYLASHRNHINYPEYLAKGYFIGSGAIESGNKIVLQKRLKLAGMRWNVPTAQCMLTIRARVESGLWNEVVDLTMRHYALQITECAAA